ncbi:MAG TPA: serine/threonine-protein kinase, partial [Candidatus Anammoximicrobium sp.]|nr:serine/threonine-protein kinase [Candidatus Anammoximicrobium sp.]
MNGHQGQSDRSGPIFEADEADRICAEFEQAWRSGTGPRIEDALDRVAPAGRRGLLQDLLAIELHARQQQGDLPVVEEYAKRFPENLELVAAIIEKHVRRRLGDYEILREIGHGGMGVVYQAQHRLLNQIVALKVLPEPALGDRQAVRRFQREMLSVGSLNHPNIIRALNAGEARDVHYLVMEYVDGWDFGELVALHGRLASGAACELIGQAAIGLQYIYEHDMVHRDIKPANLMLARDGTVKILDLGLARLDPRHRSRELTHPGFAMGTVDYMAPEQWVDSSAVDIRADIYSLGCTLFFLLTGQTPDAMKAGDTPSRRRMGRQQTHPSLAALRGDCPPDVDRILELMLAEEPDERFDTPGEVADALGALADARQVAALVSVGRQSPVAGRGTVGAGPIAKAATHPHAAKQTSYDGFGARVVRGAKRRPGWALEVVGGAAILLLVLAVWLVSRFHGRAAATPAQPEVAMADSQTLSAELCSLPGLNGRWWFDEMPWLIPSVREALAGDVALAGVPRAEGKGGFQDAHWLWNPNIRALRDRLVDLVVGARDQLTPAESALVAELLAVSRQDFGDEPLAARLGGALGRFVQAIEASGKWSAADLHTRAVLQHKIATITNDRSLAEAAAKSYDAALAAYAARDQTVCPLRARCLVDSGQLHALVLQDYAESRRRFREPRSLPAVPLLLQAEAWLNEGIASAAVNPNTA